MKFQTYQCKREFLPRTNRLLSFDTKQVAQKTTPPTSPLLLCVYVAAGTCLPSRCLAIKRGIHFTEPLHINDRRDTHTDRLMGGIYEVGRWDGHSCHDIHVKFYKDWFRHSEVNRGDTQKHRQDGDGISLR
jgi:hypothetical protein